MVNVQYLGETEQGRRFALELDTEDCLEAIVTDDKTEITLDEETLDNEFRGLYLDQFRKELELQAHDQEQLALGNKVLARLGYQPVEAKKEPLTREQQISRYDSQLQGMMSGSVCYVHLTSKKAARAIVGKEEGFHKPAEGTAIQALAFPSRKRAEEYVARTNQYGAQKLTGCRIAERAIVFETDVMPDAVNTVMSGKAKALFRQELPYAVMKEAASYALARK